LESLPGIALGLIIHHLPVKSKGKLIGVGPLCRDALLAESRSAALSIDGRENPSAAVHQALLKRACSTPGISQLELIADGCCGNEKLSQRNLLHELLEPFTHESTSLVNVNSIELQASGADHPILACSLPAASVAAGHALHRTVTRTFIPSVLLTTEMVQVSAIGRAAAAGATGISKPEEAAPGGVCPG
jgi:hypothetical protein